MSEKKTIRIGGASGFWGDSMVGAPQLVNSGLIDFLVFDYLAETTMAILAAAQARDPQRGYATDFVDTAMKQVLPEVMRQGIKVVANAGGINPRGCADALQALAETMGLSPRIAVVSGDDVSALLPSLRQDGIRDMYTDAPLPDSMLSANAYLGAFPIASALDAGADIVITGRCVDSATTLGPLIHAFCWTPDDLNQLAAGSLAGHIIECGCQATGGLHTDWQSVPDWPNMGYPIIECHANGDFDLIKPPDTGGVVKRAAVVEQMLYEIGDPGAYELPDVSCDFRPVEIDQIDNGRVRISGAVGNTPSETYKVSATALDGFRCAGSMVIIGIDAAAKAQRTGEAVLTRSRTLLKAAGFADFTRTAITLFGAESLYGQNARTGQSREVMVRIVADHPVKDALKLFAREISPAGTSWSPGTTSPGGGRPSPSMLIKPLSFLLDKAALSPEFSIAGVTCAASQHAPRVITTPAPPTEPPAWPATQENTVTLPLVKLALARSGDKGDIANIGLVARQPEWLPLLWARVTPEAVRDYFAPLVKGDVERYYLPGVSAINYVMHDALDGGGPASCRMDPLGKGLGQMLLDMPVSVPVSIAAQL